jgi:hypothetical protein
MFYVPCVIECVDSGIEHVRDGVLRCKYSGTTSVRPKTDSGGAGSDFVVSVFYGSDPMMLNTETIIKSPPGWGYDYQISLGQISVSQGQNTMS